MYKVFCDKCEKEVKTVKQLWMKDVSARVPNAQLDKYIGEFCDICLDKLNRFLKVK